MVLAGYSAVVGRIFFHATPWPCTLYETLQLDDPIGLECHDTKHKTKPRDSKVVLNASSGALRRHPTGDVGWKARQRISV